MKFFDQAVETKLKNIKYEDNILQKYDNVTYNVRFYMLDKSLEKELYTNPTQKVDNKRKLIIFETGVTTKYDLDELIIKTVYTEARSENNCLSYELSMKIKEINDFSLVNKVTLAAHYLGYDSYVMCPYHIDVWFSGYDHITKLPVKEIPLNSEGLTVLSYHVICNSVKTNYDNLGLIYNFTMSPCYFKAFDKETNILVDKGIVLNNSRNEMNLEDFANTLQKKLNKNVIETNKCDKNIQEHYTNDKYIEIKVQKSSDVSGDQFSLMSLQPTADLLLSNIFQDVCKHGGTGGDESNGLDVCTAIPTYSVRNESVTNSTGQVIQCPHISMVVNVKPDPYLIQNKKLNKKLQTGTSLSASEVKDMHKNLQTTSLEEWDKFGTLRKKYTYGMSGINSNVIEFKSSFDNMWFLNIITPELNSPVYSTINNSDPITNNGGSNSTTNGDSKQINSKTFVDELWNQIAYSSNGMTKVQDLIFSKPLYKSNQLSNEDVHGRSKKSTRKEEIESDINYKIACVGFQNLFSTANMITMNLTILGDPYWLHLFSEDNRKLNTACQVYNTSLAYHILVNIKQGRSPDLMNKSQYTKGNGYTTEANFDVSNVYQIITCTSNLRQGVFTQTLECIIDPNFIYPTSVSK